MAPLQGGGHRSSQDIGGAAGPPRHTVPADGLGAPGGRSSNCAGPMSPRCRPASRAYRPRLGAAADRTMVDGPLPRSTKLRTAPPGANGFHGGAPRRAEEGCAHDRHRGRKGRASYLGPARSDTRTRERPRLAARRRPHARSTEGEDGQFQLRLDAHSPAGIVSDARHPVLISERSALCHLRGRGDRDGDPDPAGLRRGRGVLLANPRPRTAGGSSSPGAGALASWPGPTRSASSAAPTSTRRDRIHGRSASRTGGHPEYISGEFVGAFIGACSCGSRTSTTGGITEDPGASSWRAVRARDPQHDVHT